MILTVREVLRTKVPFGFDKSADVMTINFKPSKDPFAPEGIKTVLFGKMADALYAGLKPGDKVKYDGRVIIIHP